MGVVRTLLSLHWSGRKKNESDLSQTLWLSKWDYEQSEDSNDQKFNKMDKEKSKPIKDNAELKE